MWRCIPDAMLFVENRFIGFQKDKKTVMFLSQTVKLLGLTDLTLKLGKLAYHSTRAPDLVDNGMPYLQGGTQLYLKPRICGALCGTDRNCHLKTHFLYRRTAHGRVLFFRLSRTV